MIIQSNEVETAIVRFNFKNLKRILITQQTHINVLIPIYKMSIHAFIY